MYADYTSKAFASAHSVLIEQADTVGFTYILRPRVLDSSEKISLQGFSIDLALKNMEYKVVHVHVCLHLTFKSLEFRIYHTA